MSSMSSVIRTPWPRRSAPHHWIASQIDGSPKASPAWMVVWKFSRATYWNASRWRVAGLGPGDVESDDAGVTPAHRGLGDLQAAGGGAHGRQEGVDREVGAGGA